MTGVTRTKLAKSLKGVFPPVVTPFNRRGDIDEGAFRANLHRYAQAALSGVVVAGSSGEAPFLTPAERLRLVDLARQLVQPPQLLIAGTGLESTRQTLELSQEAIARGADAVLVITPGYYKPRMDTAAFLFHFRSLADRLRKPVILYSMPQLSGVRMDVAAIATLSRHPNVVGLKESSGDLAYLRLILKRVSPGFRVLVGSALILVDAFEAGAAGAIVNLAGFMPELCVGIYEAFRNGRTKLARALEQTVQQLARRVTLPYGVAGIKAALDLCGYSGGLPRAPLLSLDSAAKRAVATALEQARRSLQF